MDRIAHLTSRVASNRQARERAEAASKWESDRRKVVEEAPSRQVMEFWCDHRKCKTDLIALAHKRRNWGYNLDTNTAYEVFPLRAWYVARCDRGHEVVRYITDKSLDPYFMLSERLKRERFIAGDDLLQPSDPRFKVVYPRQWEQLEAEREAAREKQEYMDYVGNGGY